MKLIDAIKQKGDPYWIPDCSRDELPEFFKQLGFKVGAEIGVSMGDNLELYCQAGFTMYGIDPWEDYEDHRYRPLNAIPIRRISHSTIEDVYNLAVKKTSPYPNCTLIRKRSIDAAKDIPDRSLDFVYIDGNHMFGYVAMDLMYWANKVRKGGIIAGHDYLTRKGSRSNRFVKFVVDAFAKAYDFSNWYILGSQTPVPGERTDEAISFMFFKHW